MNRLLFGSAFSRVDRAHASGRFRMTHGHRVGTERRGTLGRIVVAAGYARVLGVGASLGIGVEGELRRVAVRGQREEASDAVERRLRVLS